MLSLIIWTALLVSPISTLTLEGQKSLNVTEFKVGVIIISNSGSPYDMQRTGAAIDLAFEKVNREILNSSYKITQIQRKYGPICSAAMAPGLAADMYYGDGIVAMIGPACTYALSPVARLAGYWNIPVITGLGDSGQFKDKSDFPTMTRMSYCQCRLRKVFGSVFKRFNWTDISLIMDRDDVHGLILGETLDVGLQKGGIFPNVIKFYGEQKPDLGALLKEASDYSRVIILSVSGDMVRDFMLTALDMGYTNGEYVFMDVELFSFKGQYWGDYSWFRGDDQDSRAQLAYQSILRIALYQPNNTDYHHFTEQVKQVAFDNYNFSYAANDEEVNFFVAAFYDGVVLYGTALNETLEAGMDPRDGYTVARRMWERTFIGITDEIFMDDNGDRDTSYAILDMDPGSGTFHPVAYYWGDRPWYHEVPGRPIHWPGKKGTPPPNTPRCGFKNDSPECMPPEPMSPVIFALIAVLCAVILGGSLGFMGYRHYKLESELRDMSWLVSSDLLSRRQTAGISSMRSMASMRSDNTSTKLEGGNQIFTDTAFYQGVNVAVRQMKHRKNIDLKRSVLIEVKQRRSMIHDNLVKFVGAVVEPPKVLLLHEYCNKGSLQDLLANDSVNLDHVFKMSLIEDIIRGLGFIHSSDLNAHGRLRSTNCVVDNRFVLKLTDFGLHCFFDFEEEENEHMYYTKLLWTAPEILRSKDKHNRGTPKGDVYSFGIIMEEILLRGGPFEEASLTCSPQDIVDRVRAGGDPPFRPVVKDPSSRELTELMYLCLAEDPSERPDCAAIKNFIKKMNRGKETNILDNLLQRMEQYANNLEGLVAERTNLLAQEQKKTEQLLLQILPKSIAEQLKRGQGVDPEAFDCVTIYFSDIVGFTTLSASSTPFEVVALLNDLYTCFDSTLGHYDVYKVETIGDAYMVVSGLPERNGNNHASEIARMSLALLASIQRFRMKHRPDEQLKLRIGLHSGSCVAGVVGHKMPRYCLFGDTVNTASRMESNGLALKIHMSQKTKEILDIHDNFITEPRGTIEVKGKGMMNTYWLTGEIK